MDELPKQSSGSSIQEQPSVEPTKASETISDGNKKGTGVFFGPALASRLAGNRSGKKQPSKAVSFGRSSGSFSAPGAAGRDAGPENSRNGAGRRRASASMDLPRSPTPVGTASARAGLVGLRSTSFTAASSSHQGVIFRSSGSSMTGGPQMNLYQLISSPHGLSTSAAGDARPQTSPSMLPAQQMHVLQQQLQQQQQALDQEAAQQEQQRIQEVQQLQAQLQQLLQQQQMRAQQPAAPQQQLQYVNMHGSSHGSGVLLSCAAPTSEFRGRCRSSCSLAQASVLLCTSTPVRRAHFRP